MLSRATPPSTLKGCVGTLPEGYICNVPLPRVSILQSTSSETRHQVHTIPDYYKGTYVVPMYNSPRSIVERASFKTDKSKWGHFSFGGKVLMDKKSPPLFLGQFLFRPIIFFVFVFSFSLFQQIGSENAVEGSWRDQFGQFSQKSTLRYVNTITNNLLRWSFTTYNVTINIL